MAKPFPIRRDFELFVEILLERKLRVSSYLPPTSDDWFDTVTEAVQLVRHADLYRDESFVMVCARILYKVVKRHELVDANKRSAVISVYLFCVLNDYWITDPEILKQQAKRLAKTRGRANEEIMCKRVCEVLHTILTKTSN